MSKNPYVKNQKLKTLNRHLSAEDDEDFEQELLIKEWLERGGKSSEFSYQHINRKGRARNTFSSRQRSLQQKISEDSTRTLEDLIVGSDGRDLECRLDGPEPDGKSASETLDESLEMFFDAIGVSERTKAWAKKSVKSAESLRKLRSLMNDEKQFEISLINLELPRRWGNFKK